MNIKNNFQKKFLIFVVLAGLLFVVYQLVFVKNKLIQEEIETNNQPQMQEAKEKPSTPLTINLSPDKKAILDENDKIVFSVENDDIYFFIANDGKCDSVQIFTDKCSKDFLKNKAEFINAKLSPDGTAIGFTISFNPENGDGIAYIFKLLSNKVIALNSTQSSGGGFLDFSPNSEYFSFQIGCWEGDCGFGIVNLKTMEHLDLDTSKLKGVKCSPGYGCYGTSFQKWINNEEIEYNVTWGSGLKSSWRYNIITESYFVITQEMEN